MAKLTGTNAKDKLKGTAAGDIILGLGGDDILSGGANNDTLKGGTGNDALKGEIGNDKLFGEAGKDSLDGGAGDDSLDGGTQNDSLLGGDGNDRLTGGANNDSMNGGDGNDTIVAGPGADSIDGGLNGPIVANDLLQGKFPGDWLSYADSSTGVVVDLGAPATAAGGAAGDTWTGMENLLGSNFNDTLLAATGALPFQFVFGGAGSDIILANSGSGPVILRGDQGTDFLFGNSAHTDIFILQYNQGLDWVTELGNNDSFWVSKADFALTSSAGAGLNASELANRIDPVFFASTDRFVYETDTHILWEDKDGSGVVFFPVPIAVIQGVGGVPPATLLVSDFLVIG